MTHSAVTKDKTPRPARKDTPFCLYSLLLALGMMMAGSVAVTAVV